MLQTPVPVSSYPLHEKTKSGSHSYSFDPDQEEDPSTGAPMADIYDDDDDVDVEGGGGKERGKSRRELPAGAVATLKAWLLSPEHFTHPYPTPQDQAMLMQKTGIDKKQLKNWFTNARRRIWKPMLKKQIEQGNLTATGVQGVPGSVPGLMMPNMPGGVAPGSGTTGLGNPHSIQAMRTHYQQASGLGQPQQQVRDSNALSFFSESYRFAFLTVSNRVQNCSTSKQSMLTETQCITQRWNNRLSIPGHTFNLRSLHSSTKWHRAVRSERFHSYCPVSR
jgi:hypothetical protein